MEYLIEGIGFEQLSQIHGGALICTDCLTCGVVGSMCKAYCETICCTGYSCVEIKIG